MLTGSLLLAFTLMGGQEPARPVPTPAQRAWQDMGIGVFFHLAPNTFTDREYDDLSLPLSKFDPKKLDTDQWADAAVSIGARYVVLVAKHAGGFCLWPTKTTDYSIASTPWRGGKGDIVADLARSCRARHLKFGIYLSPTDGKHKAGGAGRTEDPKDQEQYNSIYRQQLTELLTRYGSITEVWFDGSQSVNVHDLLHRFAPNAMVFQGPDATIRWVGNEDGFAPYPAWNTLAKQDAATGVATALHGDPNGDAWMPLEVDVSIRRPDWFWHPGRESTVLSEDALTSIYYRSVGRGANLLINLPPDTDGLIEAPDVARAKQFGDEIRRRFGHPVGVTKGDGEVVTLEFPKPTLIDHIEIQEEIARGERILRHVAEAKVDGQWREIEHGTQVGERRLVPVSPVTAEAVRVRVLEHFGRPSIRRLAAYHTGVEPPADWAEEAQVWATDDAGSWNGEGDVSVDLTKKLQAAATYRVRFVGANGDQASLSDVQFMQDGIPWPHIIRPESGRSDVYLLTITAIPQSAVFKCRIVGAAKGSVLVQRI